MDGISIAAGSRSYKQGINYGMLNRN